MRYVALLRGINVGGNKVPKMIGTDLYKNMTLRNVNTLRKLHTLVSV